MCNYLVSQPRGQNRTALDEYFDNRPEDDFSRIMYGSVITASENTKGTIMSVFRGGVSIFGYDSIAKMTSESTMDFMDVGFGESRWQYLLPCRIMIHLTGLLQLYLSIRCISFWPSWPHRCREESSCDV